MSLSSNRTSLVIGAVCILGAGAVLGRFLAPQLLPPAPGKPTSGLSHAAERATSVTPRNGAESAVRPEVGVSAGRTKTQLREETVQRLVTESADRWSELSSASPMPINRKRFVSRGSLAGTSSMFLSGRLPKRFGPGSVIRYMSTRARRRLPEHRFNELLERLWLLEKERARERQQLIARENQLLSEAKEGGALIKDVESWLVTHTRILVIRHGDDEEHSGAIESLRALDEEGSAAIDRYLQEFGR